MSSVATLPTTTPITTTATTPATTNDTGNKTATGFASLQIVTFSCHGVLNTVFTPPTTKPSWFDDLDGKLSAAKVLANQWVDDLAPQLTASIPSHVINYATTYSALSGTILDLAKANPDASGPDNPVVQEVLALVQELINQVNQIVTEVNATADQLKTWGDAMQKAHDDLFNGAADIQKLETDLQADIEKMNSAIQSLRAKIDGENKAIAAGGIAIGVGLLALVVGVALAPVTGGASLIVSGIGAAAIIGGAVTWGIMQHRINEQFSQIAADQAEIADDKRQIVALQGLSTAANSAINSIAVATQALSDVKTMWQVFGNELQGVVSKLSVPNTAMKLVVDGAMVLAAQNEWNQAMQFAQQLVGATTPNVQSQTLPMAAQAAA